MVVAAAECVVDMATERTSKEGRSCSRPSHSLARHSTSASTTTTTTTSSLASTKKFLFKNSDIIFENDLIQIGVKSEMKKNLLNIEFYYGNKTSSNISNLSAILNLPGELQSGTRIKTMVFQLKKNFDLTLRITSQFGNNHFVD